MMSSRINQQSKHSTSDSLLCFFSLTLHVDVVSLRIFLAMNEEIENIKISSSLMFYTSEALTQCGVKFVIMAINIDVALL